MREIIDIPEPLTFASSEYISRSDEPESLDPRADDPPMAMSDLELATGLQAGSPDFSISLMDIIYEILRISKSERFGDNATKKPECFFVHVTKILYRIHDALFLPAIGTKGYGNLL